ncbi:MAG TPA: YkgJ family cysteine cluster protein [Allosphingosinicella sp.]|nr:YkgJ family cysteine cluster protein [Allosphingosinicella sp.]
MDRTERRRQLRDDERRLQGGLDPGRPDGPQIMELMRLLHARLEEARGAGTLAPLAAFFEGNMRAAWRAEPRQALACRRGCAHCCHAWVSARAPEVLVAKAAIPSREREVVRSAVEAAFAATAGLGPEQRAALAAPCPMLVAGECRIYGARPATCRTAVSLDAAVCAAAFRPNAAPVDIPMPDFHIVMRRGYSIALAGALKRAGYAAASYEFIAAMRAALARDDAERAWLAGEDVFAAVQTDPGSDPFEHPRNRQVYELAFAGH